MCRNARLVLSIVATCLLCPTIALPAASAVTANSFVIRQLYSNQDGNWQFVELEEAAEKNRQDRFSALTLSVTNRHGATKTFTFPVNLPNTATANKRVTIVSKQLADSLGDSFAPDYVMPNQFLPTDGGTIYFARSGSWTYDALPILANSLMRSGATPFALAQHIAGRQMYPGGGFASVYEYYNRNLDHYFMSDSQPDIDALDTGRIPGLQRTGGVFHALSAPYGDALAVCRYFIQPGSHFFWVSADECEAVARQHP